MGFFSIEKPIGPTNAKIFDFFDNENSKIIIVLKLIQNVGKNLSKKILKRYVKICY